VAFGLLSTIIIFKVVPQIPARLVISAMVGVAALCTLSPEVMTNVTCVKDWAKAIATYVLPVPPNRQYRLVLMSDIATQPSWQCWRWLLARLRDRLIRIVEMLLRKESVAFWLELRNGIG